MGTQIRRKQIANNAINNAKIGPDAAITTDKLNEGAEFVKRDGSVALTSNLSFGNNTGTNIPTPTQSHHIAPKSYVDTRIGELSSAYKYRTVRAASTANIDLVNPGSAVFDGVTIANGERVLIRAQTAPAENGIYVFNGVGTAMTRSDDANAWAEFPGARVTVTEGTTYADTTHYTAVNDGGTLGVTAIVYNQDPSNPLNSSNFVDKEIPAGAIDGANVTFTLANTPVSGSEHLFLNGILQESGGGNDYTIAGNTITLSEAPLAGEKLRATYRK